MAVARMSHVFNKLRHESQMILDLKGLTPSSSTESIPEVSDDLKRTLHSRSRKSFDEIKSLDKGDWRSNVVEAGVLVGPGGITCITLESQLWVGPFNGWPVGNAFFSVENMQ